MTKEWIHSMNGHPWTKAKMKKAVEVLRPNASVQFAFGAEKLSVLIELNKNVFSVRPDLVFHVWSAAGNKIITDEELTLLTKMENVKKVHFNGFNNTSLQSVSEMTQLTSLKLGPDKKLDISFIEKLTLLNDISLTGSFVEIEALSSCNELKTIYLSTTINSFNFFKPLNNIEKLYIDNCIATNEFHPFNKSTLTDLSITSIKMLENVDALAEFENLISLRLDASRVESLPNLNKLRNLKKLELGYMKVWKNPEVLQTLPMLEELTLNEINTKLPAEQFYFLTEMDTLTTVDFRFIDFSKNRIEKLNKVFKEKNKDNILKK
jgi:hypothetical protein